MEIVDLLESLHLHNTTFAGIQQKPGPHSHHPAALFSGNLATTITITIITNIIIITTIITTTVTILVNIGTIRCGEIGVLQ